MNNQTSLVDTISAWAITEIGYSYPVAAENDAEEMMTDAEEMTDAEFALYADKRSQHPALDNPEMDAVLDLQECYVNPDWLRHCMATVRWPDGVSCLRCGSKNIRKSTKANAEWLFVCRTCDYVFSIKSQTLLHSTEISFDYWLAAIVLLSRAEPIRGATKNRYWLSIAETAALLGVNIAKVYLIFNRLKRVTDISQRQNGMALLTACLSTIPTGDKHDKANAETETLAAETLAAAIPAPGLPPQNK